MKHIIERFQPLFGKHCITTSLRQIFRYHGHEFSEEMLFGLGSGLNFFYGENKAAPFPFVGMRAKVVEFEERLAAALNINIQIHTTSSPSKAYTALKKLIAQEMPVMIYVDMAFLKYLNLPDTAHFGGHSIVVFGIDEEARLAYVSDRDGKDFPVTLNPDDIPADFHLVPLKELETARNSTFKPFPPENKWVTFDLTQITPLDRNAILRAIRDNAKQMLHPPIKNLGVKGIRLFSEKLAGWKAFSDNKLKWSAFNVYIYSSKVGGTGGGGFRKMYGNFLRESGKVIHADELTHMGDEYVAIGETWDDVGAQFRNIYKNIDRNALNPIAETVRQLAERETDVMNRLNDFAADR